MPACRADFRLHQYDPCAAQALTVLGDSRLQNHFSKEPEVSIQRAVEQLQRGGITKAGDRVIVLSDILVGEKFIETVQVRTI